MTFFPRKIRNGYATVLKREPIHRIVALKKYKNVPENFVVHHIDGNKLNNRWNNLMLLHKKDHYRLHVIGDLEIKWKK